MMEVKKTTKSDAYFAQAKAVANEVAKWPDWKKSGFRLEPIAKQISSGAASPQKRKDSK